MNLIEHNVPLDFIVLENVYSDNEVAEIWSELERIYYGGFFFNPEDTGSGKHEDGTLKKKNKAIFLDEVYHQDYRNISPILKYTEKNLLSIDTKSILSEKNSACGTILFANQHSTLISYYENNDRYDFHADASAYSTLSYFYKEPKSFSGGDIVFRYKDEEIVVPIKNNMSIIFPSCYEHKVIPVVMEEELKNKMMGRFCISQFLGIGIS